MIRIRAATAEDALGIAGVHVSAWRAAYAGMLPADYLAQLSVTYQAMHYQGRIDARHPVYVAEADGRVVGFATGERVGGDLADGELETLYVLDDYRDRGVGRGLMRSVARHLARSGCRSAFLWVLRDNPSRWFYERMGGRRAADSRAVVAGVTVPKTAYVWDPIELLLTTPAKS